jgi:hypothetical protein
VTLPPVVLPRRCALVLLASLTPLAAQFRVVPYVQHPTSDGITLAWFSETNAAGLVEVFDEEGRRLQQQGSSPEPAEALAYPVWEEQTFFDGAAPPPPFAHRLRVDGLQPATAYGYRVTQEGIAHEGRFWTAPAQEGGPVRLIFFADSETEPESTGDAVAWADPTGASPGRRYLLDQTDGFAYNLEVIRDRHPDLIAIAGDVVESGGEQRDWDEFWRHVTDVGGVNLAGRVPLLAAPGNHEYYEGPRMERYNQPGSERAVERFRTYFAVPDNGDPDPRARGRYYRLDYGPVTLIALDVSNGTPHQSEDDTNFFLRGRDEAGGGASPGFAPGTSQYEWLSTQLADARRTSAFTFVFFHHVPYSSGPHGWPAGEGDGLDTQSGVPVRQLTPLFLRYGVDAVIAGHDEMWERSEIEGEEVLEGGGRRRHTLHVLDVGIGGDGLRGPQEGLVNPYQAFLAHADAPEIWENGVLVEGGKHYGHLEVDVEKTGDGWQAVLKPVYLLPQVVEGVVQGVARRLYDDVLTLESAGRPTSVDGQQGVLPTRLRLGDPYPNPFNGAVGVHFDLAADSRVRLDVYDSLGQRVRRLLDAPMTAGTHTVAWDALGDDGAEAGSGVYFFELRAGSRRDLAEAALIR